MALWERHTSGFLYHFQAYVHVLFCCFPPYVFLLVCHLDITRQVLSGQEPLSHEPKQETDSKYGPHDTARPLVMMMQQHISTSFGANLVTHISKYPRFSCLKRWNT